jgi:Cu/Ag efflux pump CusA
LIAARALAVAVPAFYCLFYLVIFCFGSITSGFNFTIPLSAIGGIFALWILGMPF